LVCIKEKKKTTNTVKGTCYQITQDEINIRSGAVKSIHPEKLSEKKDAIYKFKMFLNYAYSQ